MLYHGHYDETVVRSLQLYLTIKYLMNFTSDRAMGPITVCQGLMYSISR